MTRVEQAVRFAAVAALQSMSTDPRLIEAVDRVLVDLGTAPNEAADILVGMWKEKGRFVHDEFPPELYRAVLIEALNLRLAQLHQS